MIENDTMTEIGISNELSAELIPSESLVIPTGIDVDLYSSDRTLLDLRLPAAELLTILHWLLPNLPDKVLSLLVMGKKIIHMGDNGLGLSAKLAQNLQIAFIYEGLAEGLTLATKLGVQPEKLFELIQASMIRSGVAEYKAPFILKKDYSPNFPLRLMHKDMHLMLDAARESGVKLPGLEKIDEVYEAARQAGHGDLDYAATIMLLEEWAGLKVDRAS